MLKLQKSIINNTRPRCTTKISEEWKKFYATSVGSYLSRVSHSSSPTAIDSSSHRQAQPDFYQNVVVMRHGDRIDNFDPLWTATAARPWDPPLIEQGYIRAFSMGLRLRNALGFTIHRVFLSPFLRCVQTAAQVVYALCAVDDEPNALTGNAIPFDPSKIKVSIEYGLCEMLNTRAIRPNVAPKNGDLSFNIPELEAMLPVGTVETNVDPIYKQLPQWEETLLDSRSRYAKICKDIPDKYPTENLLLVTHGEGVRVSISTFMKDATVYEVDYCAYSNIRRPIFRADRSFISRYGSFDLVTKSGQTGISYGVSS